MNQNHHITHTEQYHHLVEHHQEDYEYEQDTNTKGNNKRLRIKSHEGNYTNIYFLIGDN
jgi:hypothetical protein